MTTSSPENVLGELRGLLAERPSFERDVGLCELVGFTSRVTLEQSGAWDYLCAASHRGTLGARWDDGSWCDVRAGRLWNQARQGRITLRGTTPLRPEVLEALIARTHEAPCVALDLAYLGEEQLEVLRAFLVRADLSRLVWLDLSTTLSEPSIAHLLAQFELPGLRSLELQGHREFTLLDLPMLSTLVHLGVARSGIDDAWLRQHVTPSVMPALRSLDLNHTRVGVATWEQLGEQQGFEEMFALKMRATWMTSREVGLCRWLPCLPLLDTFAMSVHGDMRGAVYEESMTLIEEGLHTVRDLELSFEGVSEALQKHVLRALAQTPCYPQLCGLGLGELWINEPNLSAFAMHEGRPATPLRKFALWNVRVRTDYIHSVWYSEVTILENTEPLMNWSRLARVQSFELEVSAESERTDRRDTQDWVLDIILSMTHLQQLTLRHLSRIEVSVLMRLWMASKTIAELETLEMHGCDLLLWHIDQLDTRSLAGPARWVFDGFSVGERSVLLDVFSETFAHDCRMWPWLGQIVLEGTLA